MAFDAFRSLVLTIAAKHGYDAAKLAAQAHSESAWNPLAKSGVGALGLMQFMPATWKEWGRGSAEDPEASLDAGVRYMKWLLAQFPASTHADPEALAYAAYNWGIGNVKKAIQKTQRTDWAGIKPALPRETQDYVERIRSRVPKYQQLLGTALKIASSPMTAVFLFLALGLSLFLRKVVA